MDAATKKTAKDMILADLASFEELYQKEIESLNALYDKKTEMFKNLFQQIYTPKPGRLMPKTPKVTKKRIQTIPEDEIVSESIKNIHNSSNDAESEDEPPVRSRRGASIKASQKIKNQQNLTLNSKLRRPKHSEENTTSSRIRPMKRIKTSSSESDEDIGRKPAKQNKTGDNLVRPSNVVIKEEPMSCTEQDDEVIEPVVTKKNSLTQKTSLPRQLSLRSSKNLFTPKNTSENSNIVEETLIEHDINITEPSMYEDALGKLTIANSTMIPNTTITIDKKIMNATVVLSKMNETVTISRNSSSRNHNKLFNEPIPSVIQSKAHLQHKMSALKTALNAPELNELITDDESDSFDEMEKVKRSTVMTSHNKTPINRNLKHSLISDTDDEAVLSPEGPRSNLHFKYTKNLKSKQNALFSPYAKESVKKRVEAFEKAVVDTPNDKIATTGRITRTKTRAMAKNNTDAPKTPSVSTLLARKSLSKAKKIIREKEQRHHDAEKENNLLNTAQKLKTLKNDKVVQKQQLRTTPISKSRLKTPMSVSRIPVTPSGNQLLSSSKIATAPRIYNNVSSADMTSGMKPISKSSSTDSLVEKRHKVSMDEDARRKKEEALKAQTEEKRRKREEKEQKIKLAREAREKMEQEKRLKLEKEKEEKARHALAMQERMREEAEKKKIAQNQKAMEKEERRKREEQLKLQRIQEQEELERKLAEQKRREQETERRRQAEARAQQLAATEAAKVKLQYQAKVKQMQLKLQEAEMQGPLSYKIDSEPDDESDSESRPKYTIPFWAKVENRRAQLEMQPYIPSQVIMNFFGVKKTTPNLADIFVGIEKKRLVRTSSAVWKTPPRFSMMED